MHIKQRKPWHKSFTCEVSLIKTPFYGRREKSKLERNQQRNQQQDQMNESVGTEQNVGNKMAANKINATAVMNKATPARPAKVSKRKEAAITQRKVFSGRGF